MLVHAAAVVFYRVGDLQQALLYGTNVVHIPAVIQITEQLVRITAVLALLLLIPQSAPSQSVTLILLGMLVSEVYSSLHLTYLRRKQPLTLPLCRSARRCRRT